MVLKNQPSSCLIGKRFKICNILSNLLEAKQYSCQLDCIGINDVFVLILCDFSMIKKQDFHRELTYSMNLCYSFEIFHKPLNLLPASKNI